MHGVLAGPGTILANRYAVERELGRGGMAIVYLATDLRHGRPVAVKILRPDLAATLGRERFLREIEIAARLTHPHILPLHDSGESEGLVYYVMPFVEGESLRERLRRDRQLPINDALTIAREVADALAYAHRLGIVHRDIKPANILLEAGLAVVADFGIARAFSEAANEQITTSGLIIGTPAYMSPEQASGGPVDGRTDVYALGCVLYEMLAGQPPFSGPTAQAVVARHLHQPPAPLRTVRPSVPAEVEALVAAALEKLPADRFPTAEGFAAALGGTGSRPVPGRVVRQRRGWLAASLLLAVGGLAVWRFVRQPPVLDPNRVVVHPISGVAPDAAGRREDITLALLASLNSTSSLIGMDGSKPNDPRARQAAFTIKGALVESDTLRLLLDVEDARDGSVTHRVLAFDPRTEPWAIGVRAAQEALPVLIRTGQPAELPSLTGRSPTAMGEYFLGERAYRRAAMAEALAHFRRAVATDSTFALAALRGAQAANWLHQLGDAEILTAVALASAQVLSDRQRELARGLSAYLRGQADTALVRFRNAAALDPTAAEPWMWLGETYNHLLPRASPLDSLAYQAFGQTHDLDSTFAPVLFHLIEFAVRRGDLARAASLLNQYSRRDPDPELLGQVELALRCVRDGMPPAAWRAAAARTPARVFGTAQTLALGGLRQPACARAALEALLSDDTTGAAAREPYRFGALLALHAILVAQNRTDEVSGLLERDTVFNPNYRGQLYVLAALAGAGFEREADRFVERGTRAYQSDPAVVSNLELWFLASWIGARGQGQEAAEMGARVLQRAGGIDGRRDSLLAASILARATLARGDTAAALEQLRHLSPNAISHQDLTWSPWEPLGGERLLLARLLLARGRPKEALDVAANFDSPVPIAYLMYLPASLSLRVQAAEQLGDSRLARISAERLAALHGRAHP